MNVRPDFAAAMEDARLALREMRPNSVKLREALDTIARLTAERDAAVAKLAAIDAETKRFDRVHWCKCGQPWIPAAGLYGTTEETQCCACVLRRLLRTAETERDAALAERDRQVRPCEYHNGCIHADDLFKVEELLAGKSITLPTTYAGERAIKAVRAALARVYMGTVVEWSGSMDLDFERVSVGVSGTHYPLGEGCRPWAARCLSALTDGLRAMLRWEGDARKFPPRPGEPAR